MIIAPIMILCLAMLIAGPFDSEEWPVGVRLAEPVDNGTVKSPWLQFEAAFVRGDAAEANKWIGQDLSFTAELHRTKDDRMTLAHRLDEDDSVTVRLKEQMFASMRGDDRVESETAAKALEIRLNSQPQIACKIEPATAEVKAALAAPGFSEEADFRGTLWKVDLQRKRIWVRAYSAKLNPVSL